MLISPDYRTLNARLHDARPDYGAGGHRHAAYIGQLVAEHGYASVLDYGSGKGTLKQALHSPDVREYDPAIPGKDRTPAPADLVVCTDVLEHIEPEHLNAVLDDIQRCAGKGVFLVVHTGPAKKILSDGRNAHLTQQPYTWWLPQLWSRWTMTAFSNAEKGFLMVGTC